MANFDNQAHICQNTLSIPTLHSLLPQPHQFSNNMDITMRVPSLTRIVRLACLSKMNLGLTSEFMG